jgi:hypothetical protein
LSADVVLKQIGHKKPPLVLKQGAWMIRQFGLNCPDLNGIVVGPGAQHNAIALATGAMTLWTGILVDF